VCSRNQRSKNRDDRRTVLYGERVLETTPEDMLVLDRVARSLLALGGRENAQKSLKYSRAFEEFVIKMATAEGRDAGRRQEERDRGQARALAVPIAREDRAERKRRSGEARREIVRGISVRRGRAQWATTLEASGRDKRSDYASGRRRSLIPDSRASDADRLADRKRLGELYRKVARVRSKAWATRLLRRTIAWCRSAKSGSGG